MRPAGSGRKKKESKAISPQISLATFAVLAGLKKRKENINTFISNAILEKAANDASKAAALKNEETKPGATGQIDLVDMLAEIKSERFGQPRDGQNAPMNA